MYSFIQALPKDFTILKQSVIYFKNLLAAGSKLNVTVHENSGTFSRILYESNNPMSALHRIKTSLVGTNFIFGKSGYVSFSSVADPGSRTKSFEPHEYMQLNQYVKGLSANWIQIRLQLFPAGYDSTHAIYHLNPALESIYNQLYTKSTVANLLNSPNDEGKRLWTVMIPHKEGSNRNLTQVDRIFINDGILQFNWRVLRKRNRNNINIKVSSSGSFGVILKRCFVGYLEYTLSIIRRYADKPISHVDVRYIKQIGAGDFPLFIPVTHMQCNDQMADITLFINPSTNIKNCAVNTSSILIETFESDKWNLHSLSHNYLYFKPICKIRKVRKDPIRNCLTAITETDTCKVQPMGGNKFKPKLVSWKQACNICTARNATLPIFSSRRELEIFITSVQHRWHHSMFSNCGSAYIDCRYNVYQEIGIYVGLKSQVPQNVNMSYI